MKVFIYILQQQQGGVDRAMPSLL